MAEPGIEDLRVPCGHEWDLAKGTQLQVFPIECCGSHQCPRLQRHSVYGNTIASLLRILRLPRLQLLRGIQQIWFTWRLQGISRLRT